MNTIRLRALLGRVIGFVAVFSLLQFGWQSVADTGRGRFAIELAVVRPAAGIANLLTPEVPVQAAGNRLRAVGGGLTIVNGCDGMETLFLLVAGFAVAPSSWRARALGALAGLPLVWLLNQARILALFYAYRRDADWFDMLHGILAPIVLMLAVVGYFYAWLVVTNRSAARAV
jgi:exosortase/archaeosortase family protein